MSGFWNAVVHGLTPYVPGEQPKIDQLIKLNTNELPYGPSPKALAAICEAICANDSEAAAQAVRDHLTDAADIARRLLEEQP